MKRQSHRFTCDFCTVGTRRFPALHRTPIQSLSCPTPACRAKGSTPPSYVSGSGRWGSRQHWEAKFVIVHDHRIRGGGRHRDLLRAWSVRID